MNYVTIKQDKLIPGQTEIEFDLNRATEQIFKERVFPVLFDGHTTGVRSLNPNGRVRYVLLVKNDRLVKHVKTALFQAILKDNGQLN